MLRPFTPFGMLGASPNEQRRYQKWVASLNLPLKEKSPSENERYIRLLNKTISHPVKMLMVLPKAEPGKPQMFCTFFKQTNCLKQGFYYYGGNAQNSDAFSCYDNEEFEVAAPPTPVSPIPEQPGQNRRINDKSQLSETILNAIEAARLLKEVNSHILLFLSRLDSIGSGLSFSNANSGLPQLTGFCERLTMVTSPAMIALDNLSATSYYGLSITSDFLQDPNAIQTLIENRIPIYKGPTHEDNLQAKIKIQVARDEIIAAYSCMGKQGYRGGWASFRDHNPDLISPEEIEVVIVGMISAMYALNKWCDACIDTYRTLVHADSAEKSYLLAHMKSMRIQDQIDVVLRVDEAVKTTEHLYRTLVSVHRHIKKILSHLRNIYESEAKKESACDWDDSESESDLSTGETTALLAKEREEKSKMSDLPPEAMELIETLVSAKMEQNSDRYFSNFGLFPLDPPKKS